MAKWDHLAFGRRRLPCPADRGSELRWQGPRSGQLTFHSSGDPRANRNIEIDPVWGLTGTMHDTAMALGLSNRDECFTVQNQVFSTVEQATAQVIGAYLASTATWEMPDYI